MENLEQQFLKQMENIEQHDLMFQKMSTHYDNAMYNLNYVKFKNFNANMLLKPNSYRATPAFKVLRKKENQLILEENNKPQFLLENDDFEDSDEENNIETIIENVSKIKDKDSHIIQNFGFLSVDPLLLQSQLDFNKFLESIMIVVNDKLNTQK